MIYVVRLCEVLIDDITITDSSNITWPTLFDEEKLPHIDGVLILYDVTNGDSVIEIPDILGESGPTRTSMLLTGAFLPMLNRDAKYSAASHDRR